MIEFFGKDKLRRVFFVLFVLSSIACVVATSWHYTSRYPGNAGTWLAWLLCLGFLLATYVPTRRDTNEWTSELWDNQLFVRVFVVLALVFVVSHIWNFRTAPWNQNGLFDDAAWDIYFAKKYIFTHEPFQAAFPDGIAREVVFHYYITFFFVPFGYNLLTFNIALLVLGLTTFIFTCLIIHELFRNYFVTIVAGLVFNFLPFHFIQTFIGHRYAMAAPLITASLYFLMTAFTRQSAFRMALSAILAALCVDSAIMGKQFVICLFAAGFLYVNELQTVADKTEHRSLDRFRSRTPCVDGPFDRFRSLQLEPLLRTRKGLKRAFFPGLQEPEFRRLEAVHRRSAKHLFRSLQWQASVDAGIRAYSVLVLCLSRSRAVDRIMEKAL